MEIVLEDVSLLHQVRETNRCVCVHLHTIFVSYTTLDFTSRECFKYYRQSLIQSNNTTLSAASLYRVISSKLNRVSLNFGTSSVPESTSRKPAFSAMVALQGKMCEESLWHPHSNLSLSLFFQM